MAYKRKERIEPYGIVVPGSVIDNADIIPVEIVEKLTKREESIRLMRQYVWKVIESILAGENSPIVSINIYRRKFGYSARLYYSSGSHRTVTI